MKRTLKTALIMTGVAMISVFITLPMFEATAIEESWFWIVGFFMSLVTIPLTMVMWIIHLSQRLNKKSLSPFALFGFLEGILLVAFVGWGIWNIRYDDGWMPGLGGALVFVFVVPFIVIVLAIDIILLIINKRK